ncbi:MAG: bifunctional diguanylate cyclase/phosphodiesterase [Geminicoccaceae bacterium]
MSVQRTTRRDSHWTLRIVEENRGLLDDGRAIAGSMIVAVLLVLLADMGSEWFRWIARLFAASVVLFSTILLLLARRNPIQPQLAGKASARSGSARVGPVPAVVLPRSVRRIDARLADSDELTGLPSMRCLAPAMADVRRQMDGLEGKIALLVFDVDGLTDINGCHGFPAGDELLRQVAERLASLEPTIVVRTSGDRFVMLVGHLACEGDADLRAASALERVSRPAELDPVTKVTIRPSLSVGMAIWPDHGDSLEDLMRRAEMAMNDARQRGGGKVRQFSDSMIRSLRSRSEMERDLERAIGRRELYLSFQSQVDLATGRVSGFEALMRWKHPERGNVPPAQFIPIAESSGLIRPIGAWLIDEACHYCSLWRQFGVDLTMAINISAAQFRQPDLPEIIAASLHNHGVPAGSLELELTESLFVDPTEIMMRRNIEQLAKKGLNLAIDDFGTGYSSLAYLKRLPVGKIKIDKSFISGLGSEAFDEAIVHAILGLGEAFGRTVLAEGVETEEQRAFLVAAGCEQAQGYLFSKPMPFRQALRLVDPAAPRQAARSGQRDRRAQPSLG